VKKKHIIFDFDGTLLDTNRVIIDSWQAVFRHYEGRERDEAEIVRTFGETVDFSMRNFFPHGNIEEAKHIYRSYQAEHAGKTVRLFDGTRELLDELRKRGHTLSIVTSRLEHTTHGYLKDFAIADYFDVVITCNDTDAHKPDPRPLLMALEKLGAAKDEAIMLGDTRFDIGCCANAGVDSVLVEWSHAIDEKDLVEGCMPTYRIAKPMDLLELV
jgi:pyrophosphatase PpaX